MKTGGHGFSDLDHVDSDGYPTDAFISYIRAVRTPECLYGGLLDEIIGYFGDYGDSRRYTDDDGNDTLFIATGGWSGCEDLVSEIKGNIYLSVLMYHIKWEVGGKYWFHLKMAPKR